MLCSLLRCLVVSAALVVLPPAPYRALVGELVSMSSSVVRLVRAGEATRQQRVQAASCFQPSSCIYWLVVPCGKLVQHELGPSRLTFSRVENRRRCILSKRSSERSAAWLSVSCWHFRGRRSKGWGRVLLFCVINLFIAILYMCRWGLLMHVYTFSGKGQWIHVQGRQLCPNSLSLSAEMITFYFLCDRYALFTHLEYQTQKGNKSVYAYM